MLYAQWVERKRWADGHVKSARRILHKHLGRGRISVAGWRDDSNQATDFILRRPGKRDVRIAWRSRQAVYLRCFQDVTVRCTSMVMGCETELDKLRRGAVRFYLNLWTNDDGSVAHSVLWDVKRAAKSGLFDKERSIISNDGYHASSFVGIPLRELRDAGAVVAEA